MPNFGFKTEICAFKIKFAQILQGMLQNTVKNTKQCNKTQNCASCDIQTGKCDKLCRYNYYWNEYTQECQEREIIADFCINYKNFDLDDGICDNCLISYTLYINETIDPIEYSCEKTQDYWKCIGNFIRNIQIKANTIQIIADIVL